MESRGVGKGANVLIEGRHLTVIVANARSSAVDALAFQLGASGTVRSDDDLVFYNQLASPEGAVRLTAPDTFTVDLEKVPISVATPAIGVAFSDEGPGSAIPAGIGVTVESRNDRYWAPTEGLTTERAAILVELYRRNSTWKLRNVSAGWEQGLSAMVTHHGVAVDDGPRTTPAATVDAAWASLSTSPAPQSMVLPANESDESSDRSEVTRAPSAQTRSHKRIAWLVAVVATLLLLVAISGRAPDRSAPVAMVNARIAQTSSSATSSTARPGTAPVAAMNSSSREVSPTAAGNSDAGKALAAPAVPVVLEREGAQSAVTALEALRVAGRAPRTGYSRARFGRSWTDDVDVDGGHNGCDTRNDVLRRDLEDLTLRPGSGGCVVTAGTFTDPYTGRPLQFTAGKQSAVQIDHVVSLSNAWQTGAASITAAQRQNLANDPLNLQSTASAINQAEGDGDAATWLPPNKAYRCTYVARQVAVKAKYRLWVTVAERQTISTVLTTCGAKPASPPILSKPSPSTVASTPMSRTVAPPVVTVLAAPSTTSTVAPQAVTLLAVPPAPPATTGTPPPAETTIPPPAETTTPPPAETTTPPSAETTTPPPAETTTPPPAEVLAPTPESTESATETPAAQADSGVYYANCAAARAAGAAPLNRGEPGYRAGLDRDHDGIACET